MWCYGVILSQTKTIFFPRQGPPRGGEANRASQTHRSTYKTDIQTSRLAFEFIVVFPFAHYSVTIQKGRRLVSGCGVDLLDMWGRTPQCSIPKTLARNHHLLSFHWQICTNLLWYFAAELVWGRLFDSSLLKLYDTFWQ